MPRSRVLGLPTHQDAANGLLFQVSSSPFHHTPPLHVTLSEEVCERRQTSFFTCFPFTPPSMCKHFNSSEVPDCDRGAPTTEPCQGHGRGGRSVPLVSSPFFLSTHSIRFWTSYGRQGPLSGCDTTQITAADLAERPDWFPVPLSGFNAYSQQLPHVSALAGASNMVSLVSLNSFTKWGES